MSLIDELGGYDEAKKFINGECVDGFDVQSLRSTLLEYRRENNIFEKGDKVVAIGKDYLSTIMTIERVTGKAVECFESGYIFTFQGIRHATQKEIAQGHRDD